MQEAIAFAVEGKVKATVHAAKLEDINEVLDDLKKGKIDGRVVLEIASPTVIELKEEAALSTPEPVII